MKVIEEWKPIKDYPSYETSSYGRVKRKAVYDSNNHLRQERILKQNITKCGYPYVILSEKGKSKTLTIHRLVALAFTPNPLNKQQVNHIDGNKENNYVWNLEWCTAKENVKKRYELGNDGNNYKPVNQYNILGNFIATFKHSYLAQKETGIARQDIGSCCRGKLKTAGGFIWKYVEN